MKLILLENIKGVGKKDQIIEANDGYARNYLIPNKKAVEATKGNMNNLKSKLSSNQFRKDEEKEEAIKIKNQLAKIEVVAEVKAGENGRIFGGVTSKEIQELLEKEHNIKIDKRKIQLKETIKNVGVFNVEIKLFEGVQGIVKVRVIAK